MKWVLFDFRAVPSWRQGLSWQLATLQNTHRHSEAQGLTFFCIFDPCSTCITITFPSSLKRKFSMALSSVECDSILISGKLKFAKTWSRKSLQNNRHLLARRAVVSVRQETLARSFCSRSSPHASLPSRLPTPAICWKLPQLINMWTLILLIALRGALLFHLHLVRSCIWYKHLLEAVSLPKLGGGKQPSW